MPPNIFLPQLFSSLRTYLSVALFRHVRSRTPQVRERKKEKLEFNGCRQKYFYMLLLPAGAE